MRVAFRTDASTRLGAGHVIRCIALAKALRVRGAAVIFVCRELPERLALMVRSSGFDVALLPHKQGSSPGEQYRDSLESLLGVPTKEDALDTVRVLEACGRVDWLVVDHYGIDREWETAVRRAVGHIGVIDDLANRKHDCNVLIDPTPRETSNVYMRLVSRHCRLMNGPEYALIRPEFSAMRPYSLRRRRKPRIRQILVSMGGADKDNMTRQVLRALWRCPLSPECRITVVIGPLCPWADEINKDARELPWPAQVLIGPDNMAQLLAEADVAIGAAGATTWERCCLGVPTLMLALAENQRMIAKYISDAGAALLLDSVDIETQLRHVWQRLTSSVLVATSHAAAAVTDGTGASRVADELFRLTSHDHHHSLQR